MSLDVRKPNAERGEKTTRSAARKFKAGEKRLLADIPADLHRKVKMRCLERGILVQDYIIALLAKDGLVSGTGGRGSAGT